MEVIGLRISCATPAATRPNAARRSDRATRAASASERARLGETRAGGVQRGDDAIELALASGGEARQGTGLVVGQRRLDAAEVACPGKLEPAQQGGHRQYQGQQYAQRRLQHAEAGDAIQRDRHVGDQPRHGASQRADRQAERTRRGLGACGCRAVLGECVGRRCANRRFQIGRVAANGSEHAIRRTPEAGLPRLAGQ